MKLSITDIELLSAAELIRPEALRGSRVTGVSTDSRTVAPGNVFFALRGEKFDGHEFAAGAADAGAAAVVVDARFDTSLVTAKQTAVVVVPDTTKAFGQLALIYRMKFDLPIIAVGGSNGKTTTKEMIAAVLRQKHSVLSTEGNLNNHLGVPQMLFRLKASHTVAVLELGTNHFGELQYLCSLALPTHAVITNIGREHLEFFKDLKGVAEEETELFRFIDGAFGAAFVNADDPYLLTASRTLSHTLLYGMTAGAAIRAKRVRLTRDGRAAFECTIKGRKRGHNFELGASGMHNVSNALAAIAVGVSFGVPLGAAAKALAGFTSASKRMEIIERNGLTILNDTYNANPDSMLAALQTLVAMTTAGRRIAVLGDMKELGGTAEREHAAIGKAVKALQPDVLVTFGALAEHISRAARMKLSYHCTTHDDAVDVLKSILAPGDTVLVKGSRGMAMETIVAHL